MKKIIAILLALVLVMSMAAPVAAATPALQIPDIPQIFKIEIKVNLDEQVYENAVQKWLSEHPIKLSVFRIKQPDFGDNKEG